MAPALAPRKHLDKLKKSSHSSAGKKVASGNKKGKSSSFNKYLSSEMAAIKASDPTLDHAAALKLAGTRWKKDQSNPKFVANSK